MPTKVTHNDLPTIAYAERQLVVVLPDDIVAAARKAEADAARSDAPIDWKLLASAVVRTMTGPLVSTLIDVTADALKAWARARQSGVNVLQIGRTQATALRFPPGHPRDGVLYVGHPAIPAVYYTIATFHRMAFEHKFAEAIDLLMHLVQPRYGSSICEDGPASSLGVFPSRCHFAKAPALRLRQHPPLRPRSYTRPCSEAPQHPSCRTIWCGTRMSRPGNQSRREDSPLD